MPTRLLLRNYLGFRKGVIRIGLFFILAWIQILFPSIGKTENCTESIGRVVSIQGEIHVRHYNEINWNAVSQDEKICPGDMLRAGNNSRAAVALSNESVLRINQKSTLSFPRQKTEQPFLLKILNGAIHIFSHRPRALKIMTPFVNGAVEGTEFLVEVGSEQASISVFKGLVVALNDHGRLDISSGQTIVAKKGAAPKYLTVIRPRDATNWTLYYPEIIESPSSPSGKGSASSQVRQAADQLAVGQVKEAQINIAKALVKEPENSDGLALLAIIMIAQNQKEKALSLATKAAQLDPQSPSAILALSYALQAKFDIDGALTTLQNGSSLNPGNTLIKARLAELWLSVGELEKALSTAQEAVALNPDIGRTQTVLGFAYLTQVKTDQAQTAFRRAITLDQASPLARLGLGLAKIRAGELEEGRGDIEIAAALDPDNSLIRSYLGKAFYEEKRDRRAQGQYSLAKKLDPMDPTPWLYDAIRKQTVNRPVEALHDLQKSIELNDNRAVYRSRLLLDEDLAARSTSLGRIYNDLGFQQRSLVEGWNSVNTDPTNFSAHRLLADSYAVLPRHEIARVSELLQSQLLQPINITPIQPRLAESNLFLLNGIGPESLSFNEFHPLFNRNQFTVQGNGLAGNSDTYGGEGIVSSIYNRLSVSGGYTHFETNGWRDNADQNDDIYSAFAQYSLSPQSSIQAEYRYRSVERGDVVQGFFKDDFLPNQRKEDTVKTARLGIHHAFSPGSDLIGNFQYATADRSDRDPDSFFTRYDLETDEEAYGGEIEYLMRSEYVNLVIGTGYFKLKRDDELFVDILGDPVARIPYDKGANHANIFLYSYIKPLDNLTVTVGGSGDVFDPDNNEAEKDKDQFNPKVGIVWNPFTNTTVRGAAFRVFKRTLITDQTVEPTHVAGFNQFFDELRATDYWVYGGAIDQKFTQNIYGGAELTYRDLNVPYLRQSLKISNWNEYLTRAYLYWTPLKWLAVSAEYLYEDIERDEEYANGSKDVETHQVPLGINFFHPSGLSASFKGTYINQEGSFERKGELGVFSEGSNDFFVIDASISYRFPKRYGLLSIEAKNLTDEDFEYFDSDPNNPRFQPGIVLISKITFALP